MEIVPVNDAAENITRSFKSFQLLVMVFKKSNLYLSQTGLYDYCAPLIKESNVCLSETVLLVLLNRLPVSQ